MFTNTFVREVRRLFAKGVSRTTATPPAAAAAAAAVANNKSRSRSHSGHKLNCVLNSKQDNVTPLLARKSPSSSGENAMTSRKSNNHQLVAHDIVCAACAVAISPQAARACLMTSHDAAHARRQLQRRDTPPHISQGRGTKPRRAETMLLL